jgi:poly(A) polymerase
MSSFLVPIELSALKKLVETESIQRIFRIFLDAGVDIRLVGGCVRDALQGVETTDIDFAVCAPFEQTLKILRKHHIKTGLLGVAYGTVSAFISPFTIEITTLRKDVKTYGRAAKVVFFEATPKCWQEDAMRRDFTINAMYVDYMGNLFDPFQGQQHLRQRQVIFIGDAGQRIREDYLRILRYYRFGAHIQGSLAPLPHIDSLKGGLGILSTERIQKEVLKTLAASNPLSALQAMDSDGVWDILFPIPCHLQLLNRVLDHETLLNQQAHVLTRLYALFQGQIPVVCARFKLSRQQAGFLKKLDHSMALSLGRVLYDYGSEMAKEWLFLQNLSKEQVWQLDQYIHSYEKPLFPLTGHDLLALGVKPGSKVGQLLKECEEWWCENSFTQGHQACLDYVINCMNAYKK